MALDAQEFYESSKSKVDMKAALEEKEEAIKFFRKNDEKLMKLTTDLKKIRMKQRLEARGLKITHRDGITTKLYNVTNVYRCIYVSFLLLYVKTPLMKCFISLMM